MNKLMKRIVKNEEGQVLVLFVLVFVILMGFTAFAVDIGSAHATKSKLQNAADSAALAGAATLTDKEGVAKNYAKQNGVDDSSVGTKIDVLLNVVTGKSEKTTRPYTQAEIDEVLDELELELKGISGEALIDLANYYSVKDGLGTKETIVTGSTYTVAVLKTKSDAELVQLAIDNSCTDKLVSSTSRKVLKSQIEAMSDDNIIAYANANNINIITCINSKGFVTNKKDDAINIIVETKIPNDSVVYLVPTDTSKKTELIEAIVKKLNEKENVTITTTIINDKDKLINKLLEIEDKYLGDKVITTGIVKGDSNTVKVTLTKYVSFSFARVFNLKGADVSVYAIAENTKWAGDVLPFINIDGNAENSTKGQLLSAWNKTSPGDKERIDNSDLIIGTNSIQLNYQDGSIEFKKGKVSSVIKEPMKKIAQAGKTVYVISIKADEIANYQKGGAKELKNGDLIPVSDTVLMKCEVTKSWSGNASDVIELKFIESYSWNSSKATYLSSSGVEPGGSVKLME